VAGQRRTPIERAIAATHGDDRQARYNAKRKRAGLIRAAVWVPEERALELKNLARDMVIQHLGASEQ
jgi:hypothetical protein